MDGVTTNFSSVFIHFAQNLKINIMESFKDFLVLYIGMVLFILFISTIGCLFVGFEHFIKVNIYTDLGILFAFLAVKPFTILLEFLDRIINRN